ncbi:tRNA (cytidine(34)-2'-O)-methyltransferase [soil metagenome]
MPASGTRRHGLFLAASGGGAYVPRVGVPLFHVVLVEPEIPNNTGNIGRSCVATGCALHLIRPLGFDTSAKACRRAGLDYWARLAPTEHESWWAYLSATGAVERWFFTTKTTRTLTGAAAPSISRGAHLVFGKETAGLAPALLAEHAERLVTLPMRTDERSLNLATAVCAVIYLGIDALQRRGETGVNAAGRLTE